MKKVISVTIIIFSIILNKVYSQNSKTFNLNSYHNYPTFVDVKFKDHGRAIGDDNAGSYAENISSSHISFGVEFTLKDYCGNSNILFWPGGLNLKAGERTSWPWALTAKCKELREESGKKFGIASISCKIINFKNLTEEAKKAKEEQLRKEQKYAEEQKAKENTKIANATKTTQNTTAQSYYSNNSMNNSAISSSSNVAAKSTWQETNDRIQAQQNAYLQQMARNQESQRINQANTDQFVNDANNLIGGVMDLFAQARIEKEKKKQKKLELDAENEKNIRLERERLAAIEQKKSQTQQLRNAFFLEFPDGGIPLSSDKIGVNKLYFFSYSYDKATLTNELPVITFANIYSISKYPDGTWPYKEIITDELRDLGLSGTINQIGYFTSLESAKQIFDNFTILAHKSSIKLKGLIYNDKELNNWYRRLSRNKLFLPNGRIKYF
uniref:hypothetical protein n=1 Tax=Mariniflexile sp. TaxID=1979402 RepID=UPI004047D5B8